MLSEDSVSIESQFSDEGMLVPIEATSAQEGFEERVECICDAAFAKIGEEYSCPYMLYDELLSPRAAKTASWSKDQGYRCVEGESFR